MAVWRVARFILVFLMLAGGSGAAVAEARQPRDVVVTGTGGTPMAGTLLLPTASGKRVPAVLIVQGSGPTDRNGNQPPALVTNLLSTFADALAAKGFAVLRLDKRGMHANAREMPGPSGMYEYYRWENFVGDTVAAYKFLAALPEVDAAHVAILGHSEGGLRALAAAAELQPPPAALVLAATPGRRFDILLHDQIEAGMRRQGVPADKAAELLAANDRVVAEIRRTGHVPSDAIPPLLALYPAYLGGYFQSIMNVEPTELAKRYRGPVLVLQGEADLQVSAERDAKPLDAALRARGSGVQQLALFPGLSHNFKQTSGPADHAFGGPVPAAVTDALTVWLVEPLSRQP